jgi:hypothetical protein
MPMSVLIMSSMNNTVSVARNRAPNSRNSRMRQIEQHRRTASMRT